MNNQFILQDKKLLDALSQLNNLDKELTLFVLNEQNQLVGTMTDGDIRRALISGKDINSSVSESMQRNFRYLKQFEFNQEKLFSFKESKISALPILDENNKVIRILELNKIKALLPVDAVIMAGGRGERLRPLTDTTPKPMLPVGGVPIIERNIDRLISYGIHSITISIKYLGNQLVEYFGNGESKGASIKYVEENKPLGTIGSISLVSDFMHDSVLIMNSDLLTNIDFLDFYKTFIEEKADLCIASIPYVVNIPYAVLETSDSKIRSFKEKPSYTYYSNAGIYLIKRELLEKVPFNTYFNATDLMENLLLSNHKVVHFPILGYWLDIGQHDEYTKAQNDIKHIIL